MKELLEKIKEALECCQLHDGDMYVDCSHCPYYLTCTHCDISMHKDALAYIQQLESAQPKWINAKEHVPADCVDVLVYRDGGFAIAHTIMDDDWTYTGLGGDPEYWMPLPEPPKENPQ
mgnify:CR=1 FL=1